MCYVLVYHTREHERQYFCYLHDKESAEVLADRLTKRKRIKLQVDRLPLVDTRRMGVPYWEEVADVLYPA